MTSYYSIKNLPCLTHIFLWIQQVLAKDMTAASLGEIMITCCLCSAGEMCRSFIDLAPASEKGECPPVVIIRRAHQDQKYHSNPTGHPGVSFHLFSSVYISHGQVSDWKRLELRLFALIEIKLFVLGQGRICLGQLDGFSQLPEKVSEKNINVEPCNKEIYYSVFPGNLKWLIH